jgi:hypothetical protein
LIRILFVDDEASILQAMQDQLAHQRQAEGSRSTGVGMQSGLLEHLDLEARWPAWLAALGDLAAAKTAV